MRAKARTLYDWALLEVLFQRFHGRVRLLRRPRTEGGGELKKRCILTGGQSESKSNDERPP